MFREHVCLYIVYLDVFPQNFKPWILYVYIYAYIYNSHINIVHIYMHNPHIYYICIYKSIYIYGFIYGVPDSSVAKNLPANGEVTGDIVSIPESGRSPGGGHGHPL